MVHQRRGIRAVWGTPRGRCLVRTLEVAMTMRREADLFEELASIRAAGAGCRCSDCSVPNGSTRIAAEGIGPTLSLATNKLAANDGLNRRNKASSMISCAA